MRVLHGIDELQQLEPGTELGTSDWLEVTQQMIDLFADATGDHQWIHVDAEKAKDGPFGQTIAHGYLTLSLVPQLAHQAWTIEDVTMLVNYGSDKVRFVNPVPSGARIRGTTVFDGVEETSTGARVRTSITVEIEGQDRPACVAETITQVIA